MKKFALVSTVFNEMSRIRATISDIENQILKPSQIVITDAGSTDGTFEELHRWSERSGIDILVLQEKKCNVAKGRNLAIKNASFDLIVSTDFGCRFHPEWLQSLVKHFENPDVAVVGGNFSVLEKEMNSWAERAAYICSNGYMNRMDDSFLPSSRSIAYYKSIWAMVGGYPEELTLAGDDTAFANDLKKNGIRITLEPQALVYWLRPVTLEGYLKEAKRYAIGDAENRDGRNLRNVIVNSSEFVLKMIFLVLVFSLLAGAVRFNFLTGCILVISGLGWRSVYRIFMRWLRLRSSKYNFTSLLYAFVFFDLARMSYLYWYVRTLLKEAAKKKMISETVTLY